jgi:hypothetical protein
LEKSSHPGWDMQRFHVCWPGEDYPRHDAYAHVEKAAEWLHMDQTGFVGLGEGDLLPPIPTGRTTPLTNAQLAAWMGYRTFYFLGIDQSYGYAHDPEAKYHFDGKPWADNPRYFLAVQRCFHRARADIEFAGGHIYDCTRGGNLNRTATKERNLRREYPLEYIELEEAIDASH